ncbi:MAG: hypothetical protein H6539_05545 [Bacteroidales bacterium]|nr:hypothetical protein [Bacteroidales bacterium]
MKRVIYIFALVLIMVFAGSELNAQNCNKFHLYGTCMQYPGAGYKFDGQSRSNVIGIGDKLVYNVIFYGDRDYKLIFCATDIFIPVHYVLKDAVTRDLIYDSKKDDYPETVELNIENTRRIMIEISVLGLNADQELTNDYFGCVGFLLNYKPLKK